MTVHVLLSLCGLLTCGLGLAADKKTDQDKLQGTWAVVYVDLGIPDVAVHPNDAATRWSVTGDVVEVTIDGDKVCHRFRIRLNPEKQPKAIDLIPQDGKWKGVAFDGIYSLEGERLKIRIA